MTLLCKTIVRDRDDIWLHKNEFAKGIFVDCSSGAASRPSPGQFDKLWLLEMLKKSTRRFIVVHGDNDPCCSYDDAREFAEALNNQFITVLNWLHLSNSSDIKELL